jgi:nitrogenase molybdenum-iron cofactor biosynthesis protein NifN
MLVRHFREAIPLATTAMTEVTTILGGEDNIEQAILTLVEKSKPSLIGLCTTGLTETRGDDMEGILRTIRSRHPELDDLPLVLVSVPDFRGALQDGFAAAVESIVRTLPQAGEVKPSQVTLLVSSALTPADVQELKDMVTAFGLCPIAVPDLASSLDGHLEQDYSAVTSGGTCRSELEAIGRSRFSLVVGESLRGAAEILEQRFGTPYRLIQTLTGLEAVDQLLQALTELSGQPVPEPYRRQRRQLQDAMLDTHFYFGRKRVALALEPDLLWSTAQFLQSMGAEVHAAVTTTKSPLLEQLSVGQVTIGDLEDFEQVAIGADLLITNSHGAALSRRLGIPLYRQGFPIFDRLGVNQTPQVGYRGSMNLLFAIGNLLLEQEEAHAKHSD